MSENKPVDVTATVIYHEDEPALPPPTLEVGLPAWLRQNLFGSPADIVITILASLLIAFAVIGFFDWAIRSANWFTIINNQRLFMMESFERAFEWRIAITVLLSALLTGVSFAAWVKRRSLRILTIIALVILAVMAALPPLIRAAVPQPSSYLTAGNIDIIDRASTLRPQKELAFIAQAGERVSLRLATDEMADIETLSELAGFSDRAANALANAARNRLDQQETTGDVFDRMASRELTETLEERTRLQIRTFIRTNDLLASTTDYVRYAAEWLTENGSLAELRIWRNRLEDAVKALDTADESLLLALEAVEDAAAGMPPEEGLNADVRQAVDGLTQTLLASEQIEDLGELLVTQLTEDLIGAAGESDDEEELIQPAPTEAAFLREMFVRLLTPQSVIDLYQPGQTPMNVAIYDAQMQTALAEGVVSAAGEMVEFEIPSDGWYVLTKDAAEGEEGTAILAVEGIFPIVRRTLSATESIYVRLTDNDLEVTDSRPQINDENVPIAVLIDNQFRGRRGLSAFLVHFVPLFFEQVEVLLLPFFITLAWGFILGRALAHLLGENTIFNSPSNRAMVLAWSLSPFLILLAYFALLDGEGAIGGIAALILKLAAALGAIALVSRIDDWLNRANRGEDAEAPITRLLMYGWGIYPLVMYVLTSGVGGLSGAAAGSLAGGLVWLLLMYFVGIHFKGWLGYGLLIGGFFLQIVQAFVLDIVWDSWTDEAAGSIFIWLILAAVGMGLGLLGVSLKGRMDVLSKRLGYLLCCGAFVFVLIDTNLLRQPNDPTVLTLAGIAFLLWLGWMFFTGAHRWSSNRIMLGLLLLTFLWLQTWTALDRWSIVYFTLWLVAGAIAFRRGENAQDDQRKPAADKSLPLFQRFSRPGLALAALGWLLVLFVIPGLVRGLESWGILQTSADDLLPLSDKRLWGGLMLTMQLTILGIVASFPIGLSLALGRRSRLPVVKYACILYIETVRGVPLITVLFMATLLVPLIDPTLATIENAVRAWVGITLFSAAYLAENVRGGLQSIAVGQTEAAQAIGLSAWQSTLYILLPQALRAVIPALVGQFISLFKDTSLVFIVGLAEITGIATRVVAQSEFLQRRQEAFLYVAILYFVFSYIMSYISRRVEATGSGAARAQRI